MFEQIIDFTKAKLDDNGILVVNDSSLVKNLEANSVSLEDINKLQDKLDDVARNKLADHWSYVNSVSTFNDQTVYLEIGCWPAYLGEYLMVNFGVYFIGVDFNYLRLLTIKKSFEQKGYKNYLLICGDINYMPIKDNSIDFVYGGGVIEHLKNTRQILGEIFRVLKVGGISYNTVPALNVWWLTRFYNTIPDFPLLKWFFEFIQLKIMRGATLAKHHGYQQAFTRHRLKVVHAEAGFKEISVGPFAFHPSDKKTKSKIFRSFLYKTRQLSWLTAIYFVYGKK